MNPLDSGIAELMKGVLQYPNPPGAPRGLYVIPEWISEKEEEEVVAFLCVGDWSSEISSNRPTKHFGYSYNYKGVNSSWTKNADDWGVLKHHADRIERELPGIRIGQCLANLYFKKSGIAAHRDKETPTVFGVSLAGDINMVWTNMRDPKIKYEACIPRRSLYIMCDDAAFEWKHEVPSRATVKYPDLDPKSPTYGQLNRTVSKPDWYTRVSITYRHFRQPVVPGIVFEEQPYHNTRNEPPLEAMHLKAVIPNHREHEERLFREHRWTTIKSRYGNDLSRQVCGMSHLISETSAIYAIWLEMFCDYVLGVKVKVMSSFANLYPDGKSALPAHRDAYGLWVMGLSFGETRTFDFISNGVKPTAKTSGDGEIISIPMDSGDLLLFSPEVNKTHRHRILPESLRQGRRINITYFVAILPGQDTKNLINPPPIQAQLIPTFAQAEGIFRSVLNNQNGMANMTEGQAVVISEDEHGHLFIEKDGSYIPVASIEEALANLTGAI